MIGSFNITLEELDVHGDGDVSLDTEIQVDYQAWPFKRGDNWTPNEPAHAEIIGWRVVTRELDAAHHDAIVRRLEAMDAELCALALEDANERDLAAKELWAEARSAADTRGGVE